jgi:Ribbon-helix-helix protein, copG family
MDRKIEVEFDEFGWEALTELARREGVSIEELVRHAAMYYLADADRDRFSHHVRRDERSPDPTASGDEVRRQV